MRTDQFGLGARTPFQDIRDAGVTHTYHELRRAFPFVEPKATKFAVESSNELIYRITCFRELSYVLFDADSDADR